MLLITAGAAACVVPLLPVLLFVLLSHSPVPAPFHVHREMPLGLLLAAALLLLLAVALLLLAAALLLLGDLDNALQDAVVGLLLCDGAEVPVLLLLPSHVQRVEDDLLHRKRFRFLLRCGLTVRIILEVHLEVRFGRWRRWWHRGAT